MAHGWTLNCIDYMACEDDCYSIYIHAFRSYTEPILHRMTPESDSNATLTLPGLSQQISTNAIFFHQHRFDSSCAISLWSPSRAT